MTVVSPSTLVLTRPAASDIDANNGIIGRNTLVTAANVAADTEATGYPATNVANPITSLRWKANTTAAQYLTVSLDGASEADYVGIQGHNLGSAAIPVSVETQGYDGSWTAEVGPVVLADDGAAILRFTRKATTGVRLAFAASSTPAQVSVMYVGALIVLPHRYWVGQSPITLSREPNIVTGRSISGQFTGSIEVGGSLSTRVALRLLTQAFYRDELDVLFRQPRRPFFFAWRPGDYPRETGYGVIAGNPRPVNETVNGLMAVDFDMVAVP